MSPKMGRSGFGPARAWVKPGVGRPVVVDFFKSAKLVLTKKETSYVYIHKKLLANGSAN